MSTGVDALEFVAEFACIHEGNGEYLLDLAKAVRDSGATAVKFQAFDVDEMVARTHPDYDIFKRISFSRDEWVSMITACRKLGLSVWLDALGGFSFDVAAAAGDAVSVMKIHSSDIGNPDVFQGIKGTSLPVAIGCGGTSLVDLFGLVDQIGPDRHLIFMHGYQSFPRNDDAKGGPPVNPQAVADLDLWRIKQLRSAFPSHRVGLADHLAGSDPMAVSAPSFAVSLGAQVIEKHVALSRNDEREDYYCSLVPAEFAQMRTMTVAARAALGSQKETFGQHEEGYSFEMKRTARVVGTMERGGIVAPSSLRMERDGSHQPSARFSRAIGRSVVANLDDSAVLTNAHLNQNVGVFCNARLASQRLPEKALLPFWNGLSTLGYLLTRLKSYPGQIGEVVFATTNEAEDDALEAVAAGIDVPCFRGPSEDVMGRMVMAAEKYDWDVIVRVTGDDQFVSCEYIERAIAFHREKSLDFTRVDGLPIGMACEVIDATTLKRVHDSVVDKSKTEYLTWFLDSDWVCRNGVLKADEAHRKAHLRVTLDYREDYELMRTVAEKCHQRNSEFYVPVDDLIFALEELQPEWVHRDSLWKLARGDIDTRLRYVPGSDEPEGVR